MPPLDASTDVTRPWICAEPRWSKPLLLPADVRATIAAWVAHAYPVEGCGLLVGREVQANVEVVRAAAAKNIEPRRAADRFTLAPEDWLAIETAADRDGLEVVGIWHSHPDHPALPSETDLAGAWAGYAYLIVAASAAGAGAFRSWQLEGGVFIEQTVTPTARGLAR